MNVLFLLEDLCLGGTQRQNVELALRLDRARFKPTILTLTGPTDLDHKVLDGNLPLVHMGSNRKVAPFFFARLGSVIKKLQPDVIIPCTALPNIWGRLWGKILHIPVLGTVRGGGAPVRQHERFLWQLTAHMVCNSRALFDVMRKIGVPENRLSFIPNGVDTERFHPGELSPSSRNPLIVCVARLARDKDHATLLRAFELVARQTPDARLRLVGDGPEEAALRKLAAAFEPSIGSRVEFAGPANEPAPHYREGRIFALSSIREGTPNVIMEAMSSETPVCATAVGGIPDLLGKNGLLSEPGDYQALAANLLSLLQDGGLADKLGRNSRLAIERGFSFRAMTEAHELVLESIAVNQARKRPLSEKCK